MSPLSSDGVRPQVKQLVWPFSLSLPCLSFIVPWPCLRSSGEMMITFSYLLGWFLHDHDDWLSFFVTWPCFLGLGEITLRSEAHSVCPGFLVYHMLYFTWFNAMVHDGHFFHPSFPSWMDIFSFELSKIFVFRDHCHRKIWREYSGDDII